MTNHKHRPGWLIRTYANPRGNRTQLGFRNNPVTICKICGRQIIPQNRPSRLLAVCCISFLLMMLIGFWIAFKWDQPLLLLPLVPLFFVGHYAIYRHTTFVLLKYHQRHKR